MKKLLLIPLFVSLFCVNGFALTIFYDVFEGSALCENLSTTCPVPDSLQEGYSYTTEILVNEETKEVTLSHYFQESETSSISTTITTDLNETFSGMNLFRGGSSSWSLSQYIIINNDEVLISEGHGYPFKRCYEYSYNCDFITVYAKEVRPICPTEIITFDITYQASGDSILFFPSFASKSADATCLAEGFTVVTDSAFIPTNRYGLNGQPSFNLTAKKYTVFQADSIDIVCVTDPCPEAYIITNKLGEVDLSECEFISYFRNVFIGSALCGNLSIQFSIPDSLQGRYEYDYAIEKSDTSDHLFIRYYLNENPNSPILEEITVDLSEYYSINEIQQLNPPLFVPVVQTLLINHNIIFSISGTGYPYSKCYEYKATCENVTLYQKSIREVCPSVIRYPQYYSEIKGDIIMGNFSDSIVFSPYVCFAIGFSSHLDSIVFDNVEALNYRVYLGSDINCVDGVCNTMDLAPIFLGNADLSECIINSINPSHTTQNYIHPNPTNSFIHINGFVGTITLTNQFGQQFNISGNEQFVVSDLNPGIYIATFELDGTIKKEKIVIQ